MRDSEPAGAPERREFIIFVPDLSTGGGERATRQMAEGLLELGANVTIVSAETLPREDVRWFPIDWRRKTGALAAYARAVAFTPQHTTTIAVLTGPYILLSLFNQAIGRRLFAIEHSDIQRLYLSGGKARLAVAKGLLRLALPGIAKVFVVSPYLRDHYIEMSGLHPERVEVIQNAYEPFLAKIGPLPAGGGGRTAYLIGRYAPEKRFEEALSALVVSEEIDRIIIISGLRHDPRRAAFERLAGSKSLEFYDSYFELPTFDTDRSVLVNFGAVESYSLVIAEWLSSGLPVVSAFSENLASLWSHYSGFSFFIDESGPGVDLAIRAAYATRGQPPSPVPVSGVVAAEDILRAVRHAD